ncbi:MAG: phosphotransferase enzyme family protein [Armatimonadota bacterium]
MRIIAGNINMTYCLRHLDTDTKFIIQKMNTIFDIEAIDNNLQWLEKAQALSRGMLPAYWQEVGYVHVTGSDSKMYHGGEGEFWRVMRFIPGEIKIFNSFAEVPEDARADVARSLGEAIATFGDMLRAVPGNVWKYALPNFHNAHYHLDYYRAVLRGERVPLSLSRDASRKVKLKPEIMEKHADRIKVVCEKIEKWVDIVSSLDNLEQIVTHGDTKINNFVFRPDAEGRWQCICLIDLDTVQPGNLLDDIGDALRFTNPAGEEAATLDDVTIDADLVGWIVDGYLSGIAAHHGPERCEELRKYAIDSAKLFLYAQCLRFFTDALVGNKYFKLKPGQHQDINLYRGEVQMRALEEMDRIFPA